MNKQQIIQKINTMVIPLDKGQLMYTNRTKNQFQHLLGVAECLIDTKNIHDMLAEEFTIVEIMSAIMDGTTDPVMNRVLHYRREMAEMIDELVLG